MALSIAETSNPNWMTDNDWQGHNLTSTLPSHGTLSGNISIFRQGPFRIEVAGSCPKWLDKFSRSLIELLNLDWNWDSYGGSPIDPQYIEATIEFALNTFNEDTPVPSVVPTSAGSIQLEWHTHGIDLEIEILSATRVSGFFEDLETTDSWEEDLTYNRNPVIDVFARLSRKIQANEG